MDKTASFHFQSSHSRRLLKDKIQKYNHLFSSVTKCTKCKVYVSSGLHSGEVVDMVIIIKTRLNLNWDNFAAIFELCRLVLLRATNIFATNMCTNCYNAHIVCVSQGCGSSVVSAVVL